MTTDIVVSIIVAAYKAEAFIEAALASALSQTETRLEVLVIDDCSPDRTGAIVQDIAARDPRVRLLSQTQNGGPSVARNRGLAEARGAYIAVLDADDVIAPERLEQMIAALDTAKADIAVDNMVVVPPGSREGKPFLDLAGMTAPRLVALPEYARANRIFVGDRQLGYLKPLFRTSFLRAHGLQYDEAARIGEDYALCAEILAAGGKMILMPQAWYYYTINPNSISRALPVADVRMLMGSDARLRSRFAASLPSEAIRALDQRLASLRDAEAFIEMVESLKARRIFHFVEWANRRPLALRHFHMPVRAALRRVFSRKSVGAGAASPSA